MSSSFDSEIVEKDQINIVKINKQFIPILTLFEVTSLIAVRTTQLEKDAPPCVDYSVNDTPKNIAIKELEEKKIPFHIKRKFGNYVEIWKIDELELNTDLIPYD